MANAFDMYNVETFFLNRYVQHSVKVRKLLSVVAHTAKESIAERKQNVSDSNKVPV